MVALLPLVLVQAVSASAPADVQAASDRIASTFDQAACGDSATDYLVAPPAVVDCNDPLLSPWVGEMIGSCDMPRQADASLGPAPAPTPRPIQRLCDGGDHCGVDAPPLRAAERDPEQSPRLAASLIDPFHHTLDSTTIEPLTVTLPPSQPARRVERPPRSARA